ncbi:chromosomal replication initiator protein DnaA, partial [Thermodesulfobacteriota bacterium]
MTHLSHIKAPDKLWGRLIDAIQESNSASLMPWLEQIELLGCGERELELGFPDEFSLAWVQDRYLDTIRTAFEEICQAPVKITFRINPRERVEEEIPIQAAGERPSTPVRGKSRSRLNENYTFENFVVGKCNHFAYQAVRSACGADRGMFNPIYIWGGVGLGKSHLVTAAAHVIHERFSPRRSILLTAEEFTNEMVRALKGGHIDDFKTRYRNRCDFLVVDDVHFFGGKKKTQAEFHYILDTLYNTGKTVIFTGNTSPQELGNIEEGLCSRMTSGLTVKIDEPDSETRKGILKAKAAAKGKQLPDDVVDFLGACQVSNVRTLEGLLLRLIATESFVNEPISLDMARKVVEDMDHFRSHLYPIRSIQNLVARYYHLTIEDLRSKSRKQKVTVPRQIAIHICRKHTGES